jgi:hypothetical protein
MSKFLQCNYDCLKEFPFVIISYAYHFRRYRSHDPLGQFLKERCEVYIKSRLNNEKMRDSHYFL